MSLFAAKNQMRAATLLLCGAFAALPALAQQEQTPPPPPPDAQTQGPPPSGAPPAGPRRGGANPERRAEMLQQRLGLSADQTTQVKAILVDGKAKMDAMRVGSNPPDRKQMRAMNEEENGKIRAVLTEDQRKKFDDMEAQQRERMKERRDGGQSGPPPAGDTPPPPPPPPSTPQQ